MNKLKPNFLPPTTTVPAATRTLNATINRLSAQGFHREVVLNFISVLKPPTIPPDAFTYPPLLKACTSLNLFSLGLSLHQQTIVNGLSEDPYISSSLINFHAKFMNTRYAQKVFDMMPYRNIVPWTAIIGCYSRGGIMKNAFFMYNSMQNEGIQPSSITILTLLSGVSDNAHMDILHCCIVKTGFQCDIILMNCMLSVYAKCGRVGDARKLFESLNDKDIVSWNSLINAYSAVGNVSEVFNLLYRMKDENLVPDQQTFGSLISAVAREGSVEVGRIVHGQIVTSGFQLDKHVETSLMVMYSRCGKMNDSLQVFNKAGDKDAVSWTAMISGLVQNNYADKALAVFRRMMVSHVIPSTATMTCVLAACGQLGSIRLGTSVHCYMLRQRMAADIPTYNSLVSMYGKCGHLKQSYYVFSMMNDRDVVTWNAIVSGYAQNGNLNKALYLFNEMRTAHHSPDSITIISLLQGCASIGAFQQGIWIHNFVVRNCVGPCIMIDTALVDMYAKCGDLSTARKCFDRMPHHDMASWSTIIAAYGSHGKGEMALEMFAEFLQNGHAPNDVMFLSVLYSCSHNGLVGHGMSIFESMKNEYKIEPKLEHCACIVDLLCRAGKVEDAFDYYKRMFPEPMEDVLGILLDACRKNGEQELGEIIAKEISGLKPEDAGKYVQLAHSFASMARWDGVGEAWLQMRSLGLRKTPGWSFIEMHGTVTTFFSPHSSHPQYAEIISVLRNLTYGIRQLVLTSEQEDFVFDSNVL
ncbi:pentatricopeptide repeat-containing protein At4g04370 [Olea europaea var. sylvestris]|uniref:pentatricopeptide repeat-containing protein At4g04370 n=1 Tax=Olea europaea var. sylvestris TaxID=158386 RepID=UPI000C1D0094|nr:pentatricopeptide repeat-containing protein At4g04370 [Olea europaea var. sylvestris]